MGVLRIKNGLDVMTSHRTTTLGIVKDGHPIPTISD